MTYYDQLHAIELESGVTIEVSDESGSTFVYAYTADGDRIGFEFRSMNPSVDDVRDVAASIATLRRVCDRRPRVGKVQAEVP